MGNMSFEGSGHRFGNISTEGSNHKLGQNINLDNSPSNLFDGQFNQPRNFYGRRPDRFDSGTSINVMNGEEKNNV